MAHNVGASYHFLGFFHFISVKDSSLISLDTPFEESLNEFSSYNSELFETRRLQFILQKQNIKQFSLVIDNIEALATDKYYILIGQFVECFRLLTENSFQAPVIKILFSFRPNTLYEAKQVCDIASSAYLPHSGKSRLGCEAGAVMKFVFIPFVYCWRAGTD